jgi:hypothetical protein
MFIIGGDLGVFGIDEPSVLFGRELGSGCDGLRLVGVGRIVPVSAREFRHEKFAQTPSQRDHDQAFSAPAFFGIEEGIRRNAPAS